MTTVTRRAHARAGLMGNPSDGYGGKALALEVRAFFAEVSLEPSDGFEVVSPPADRLRFDSLDALSAHVSRHGYYGGERLLLASARAFKDHCDRHGVRIPQVGFRMRYRSTIPRQVGLAGSSAIVVAALRALVALHRAEIPDPVLASLALAVERDELGIPAGLMDRVVQVMGGLVAMDLTAEAMHEMDGYAVGAYRRLDPELLPRLYLAYATDLAEPTEAVHGELGRRFAAADPAVLTAMSALAAGVDRALEALEQGDGDALARLMDDNFDLRRSVCHVAPGHARMVETARAAGASAKFAGSGGAIVGVLPDDGVLAALRGRLGALGCLVLEVPPGGGTAS